jgi:tRNA nucleotidyltransferase/poly(A) polymerase
MKVFTVGGYVRDTLMGITPKDRDFVVVGSNVSEMESLGYSQVGKDFPVFLHPKTGDEYALARTERKTGTGYNGFTVETKDVSLEDDLFRRDLTINAMAMDEDGTIIDPFGGQKDLKNKVLRHVSEHFAEDPLRVLRVARFAARYAFTVAPETLELMKKIVDAGEIRNLTAERVWVEFNKALSEPHYWMFIKVLHTVGALYELPGVTKEVDIDFLEHLSEHMRHSHETRFYAQLVYTFKDWSLVPWKMPAEYSRFIELYSKLEPLECDYTLYDAATKLHFIMATNAIHDTFNGKLIIATKIAHDLYRAIGVCATSVRISSFAKFDEDVTKIRSLPNADIVRQGLACNIAPEAIIKFSRLQALSK